MKNQTKKPDVLVLLNDNQKVSKRATKAELAIQKEQADEKKLIWKALNYSFHVYSKRGKVKEAIEMSDMLKKYFPAFVEVDEDFENMIRPNFSKSIKRN